MKRNIVFMFGLTLTILFLGWSVYDETAYPEDINLRVESKKENICVNKQYEYREISFRSADQLNSLGRQGWVVCGIIPGLMLLYREIEENDVNYELNPKFIK